MNPALTTAGVLVVAGGICLCAACWKRQSVLGGLLGAVSIGAVLFGIASGGGRHVTDYALGIGAVALVIGTALYSIGEALGRLLDEQADPDDGS